MVLKLHSVDLIMQYDHHSLERYCRVVLFVCDPSWCQRFHLWIKPCSVVILWRAVEQYFLCGAVYLAIQCGYYFLISGSDQSLKKLLNDTFMWCCLFCETVWVYLFSLWIKPCSVTILWKATEHYFHVVLFVLLDSVGLSF